MAFKTGGPRIDHDAELMARQAVQREAAATETLETTVSGIEFRHQMDGSWKINGADMRTGSGVVIDSSGWPAAERDAFVAIPAVRYAIADEDATLRLTLRGRGVRTRFGIHFEAQFASVR